MKKRMFGGSAALERILNNAVPATWPSYTAVHDGV
jgi:hypothetical protein